MVERKIEGRQSPAARAYKKLVTLLLGIDSAVTDCSDKSHAGSLPMKRLPGVECQCEIEIWRCDYFKFIGLHH